MYVTPPPPQVLLHCHAALAELPDSLLVYRQPNITASLHHMIASTAYHAGKVRCRDIASKPFILWLFNQPFYIQSQSLGTRLGELYEPDVLLTMLCYSYLMAHALASSVHVTVYVLARLYPYFSQALLSWHKRTLFTLLTDKARVLLLASLPSLVTVGGTKLLTSREVPSTTGSGSLHQVRLKLTYTYVQTVPLDIYRLTPFLPLCSSFPGFCCVGCPGPLSVQLRYNEFHRGSARAEGRTAEEEEDSQEDWWWGHCRDG